MKLKYFCYLIGIDAAFLISFYFYLVFMIGKLKNVLLNLQDYASQIGGIEKLLPENLNTIDYNKLQLVTNDLKGILSGILVYFFVCMLGVFLLYCLFQGINWNLAYNFLKNKFKLNYKYVLKFSLASVAFLSLGMFLFYHLLLNARFFLLGKLMEVSYDYTNILKIAAFGILWILLTYYSFIFYALLNSNSFGKTIKDSIKKINAKNFLYFLASFFCVAAIIILFLRLGVQNIAVYFVEIITISLIVEKYRIYLLKKI